MYVLWVKQNDETDRDLFFSFHFQQTASRMILQYVNGKICNGKMNA